MNVGGNIRAVVALGAVVWASATFADFLPVVNGSFESPSTTFVSTMVTGWTFDGPPDTGLAGVFTNNSTSPDSPAHIQNAIGTQLVFMSTESQLAVSAGEQLAIDFPGVEHSIATTPEPGSLSAAGLVILTLTRGRRGSGGTECAMGLSISRPRVRIHCGING